MLAERGGELGACAGEALANRIGTQLEDLGDLGGLHALDADQQRDLAIRRRQGAERALECELRLRIGESRSSSG